MVDVREQVHKQYLDTQDMATRSMHAWNELMVATTDMAFDVVLKNWNYSRSLRNSADQAIEDAIKTQHRLSNEMLQVWQGYTSNLQEIATKAVK